MQLAPQIINTLDSFRTDYEIMTASVDSKLEHKHYLEKLGAARGFLLQDSNGKVLAIAPANSLIDLQALNQQLKRDLRAVPKKEVQLLTQNLNLDQVSALPMAMGIKTVVDTQLLAEKTVIFDSGCYGNLIKTQSAFLQRLAEQGLVLVNLSVPTTTLAEENSLSQDQKQIAHSIANFTSRRIKGRLEDTVELPPLPITAQRILHLLVDPNADIEDLTQIVEMDPSLAAQVISWALSPYYSAPGNINSIHDAIVRVLGYDLVMNLSLGLALSKTLTLPKEKVEDNLSFWEQAIYCAALMEALARAMPAKERPDIGLCYLAGLLHNFGYLLLAEIFPPHFTSFCRYMEVNQHLNHSQVENFLLQTNREQMSYWLLHTWGIPEDVCLAIRFQNHSEYNGNAATMVKLLYTATRLLRQNEATDIKLEKISDQVLEDLHLDSEVLIAMAKTIFDKDEDVQAMATQLAN